VINRCYKKDGRENKINGIAQVVDTQSKAKLRVSFFSIFGWHLFWGDYWIIGLDKDYRWAIVGSPDRKYGWILCRVPTLSENEREKIFDLLQKRGYEPNQFLPTRHETGNRI
jgi:apolipoprotein D and lipocalin family protein